MEPVRVKYYGLFPITKRRYLILQTLVFILIAILVFVTVAFPRFRFGLDESKLSPAGVWILDHLFWIVLLMAFLESLDAFFTLRQFGHKEAALRSNDVRHQPVKAHQ